MTKNRARFVKVTLQALAAGGLLLTGWVARAEVQWNIQSDSLLRFYDRETRRGGTEKTLVPGYEFLQIDAGTLDGDGFSFHGFGWGRHNFGETGGFGDDFDDRAAGEVMYGYLEYYRSSYKAFARLGRQNIFSGTSNLALDGVRVGSDLTSYFSAEGWAGKPVALETVDGRGGDQAYGGRIEHHYKTYYTVGLSFKRIDDDDDEQQRVLAVDSSFRPPAPIAVTGYSARNLREDEWQEHSYDARLTLKALRLGLLYRRYDLRAFTERERFNAPALTSERLLGEGEDLRLTQWGGDLVARPTAQVEAGIRFIRTDNDEDDDTADRLTALLTLRGEGLSRVGAEVGRQSGDEDETTYWLTRGFFYWQKAPGFLSGDLVYAKYDEDVWGEDHSFFASLGVGRSFMKDTLELRLSGDYNDSPFFDSELRGTVAVSYKFSR